MIKNFTKRILSSATDSRFETFLYERAIKFQEAWYNSNFLNVIRRHTNPAIIKLKYKLRIKDKKTLKLNLGCGSNHFEGYINIDWRKTRATDLVCDVRILPYHDNSIELIVNYHLIEHVPRHELLKVLKEWNRVLVSGGKLIIEFPDFDEIVRRYLKGDEKQLDGIFGLQRFEGDYHFFGYNFERIKRLLKEGGFSNIKKKDARDYHTKEWPCIRVECVKDEKDVSSLFHAEQNCNLTFTGERVIEGDTPNRIWLDHVARYKLAGRYINGKEVLDISCGAGYGSQILYNNGSVKVIGIDISRETIEFARNKYKIDGLEFKVGNILDINFTSNYFDVIACFETIEHVKNQQKAFLELQRVLKPEGLLIISSPNRKVTSPCKAINEFPINPFHVIEYSTDEFVSVLKNYFEILEIYGQRGISRFLFTSFFAKIMMRLLHKIYEPGRGNSELEQVSRRKEYRYITVICKKIRE